ncbi:DUF2971 domain-containing protein [Acinetobacter sp. KS-LM10]|uniref:DUF2971 domain-containing protein n=1 Tax=Acinetobacter sp. KS-LM10 TaxID=3120518 RepID=UPI0030CF5F18
MSQPRNFFEEGFIRLSQLSALNDPFEAAFCEKSLDELVGNFDDSESWDPEFGRISYSKYVQLRMNNVGVISFSENKENLLMWAHYANEHKGMVAGVSYFKDRSIFENLFKATSYISSTMGEEWSLFNGVPKPVCYRKGMRYRNDKFDYDYSNIAAEGADRILYEVFLQKSDEWIYEQEYRVILRLEQADRVTIPDLKSINDNKIIEKLKTHSFVKIDSKGNCTIDLYKIEDEAERLFLAMKLAKLSINPKVLYFMKLSSSAINNCLLGLNCISKKEDIYGTHAIKTGSLDVWKAKKNLDYYSLEFDEIR